MLNDILSDPLDDTAPAEAAGVPFYDGSRSFEDEWPDIEAHINDVFADGKFSHGVKIAELEKAISRYTGARHAIAVNNASDALVLLLRAAGIGPGDEVVVPCFTFFSTASSVAHTGARPVFVDIDPRTYSMVPDAVAAAVTDRTKAIMPVHLFNQLADMPALRAVADRSGVDILEDSAEAIGMFHDGVHAGLLGRGGVLSFFPTKTLGALGDAGMIITDDPLLADRCAILRHHGRMGTTVARISGISNAARMSGTNSKMDDIQAAVLLARLPRLQRAIARRAAIARYYTDRLADLPQVRTPTVVPTSAATNPVWYVYLIEADRRDELVAHLTARGIQTEVYYPTPLHLQPCFADLGHRAGDFPNAERACSRAVALPLYPDLGVDRAERVCQAIESFYHAGGSR